MAWKFDPILLDIVWVQSVGDMQGADLAYIQYGIKDENSDLVIDAGERTNTSAVIDQGERFLNGDS